MIQLDFSDKSVSYDVFMNDLAARVATNIRTMNTMPDRLSQRQAYERYGRANVNRWRKQGKLHTFKRPGKIEYLSKELLLAQQTIQDYF